MNRESGSHGDGSPPPTFARLNVPPHSSPPREIDKTGCRPSFASLRFFRLGQKIWRGCRQTPIPTEYREPDDWLQERSDDTRIVADGDLLFRRCFAALVFVHFALIEYVADDAYIHLRVAEHLLRDGVPYFNLGEPVMASSSSLRTIILVPSLRYAASAFIRLRC